MIDRSRAPAWFPDWKGETAVIVGAGPSATDEPVEMACGRARVIAVNSSYLIAPEADAVYGCDCRWWNLHGGLAAYGGLKISQDENVRYHPSWHVRTVVAVHSSDEILMKTAGVIGWAGNSGFQAINLAAQFGVARIILVGFDMTLANGCHWHGPHQGLPATQAGWVDRHRRAVDAAAETLKALGIEVINATRRTALRAYPVMTLVEALDK